VHTGIKKKQWKTSFHQGQTTKFLATSNILDELDKWTGVSDNGMKRALNSYCTWQRSTPTLLSRLKEESPKKQLNLLDQLSHP